MVKKLFIEFPELSIKLLISEKLTEQEKCILKALFFYSEQSLKKNSHLTFFTITLVDLQKYCDLHQKKVSQSQTHPLSETQLQKVIAKLYSHTIEYIYNDGCYYLWGISSIIENSELLKKNGKILLKYSFSYHIRQAMKINRNYLYEKINSLIIKGIKNKYALILYDLLKEQPENKKFFLSIEEFRKILDIENKYTFFPALRKKILYPALKEINENTSIPFIIEYNLKKEKQKYSTIIFKKIKKPRFKHDKY